MELNSDDYRVLYDPVTHTVTCEGSFRLSGVEEYAPIVQMLNQAADGQSESLALDLRGLTFLNSSGINVLSRFVIAMRQRGSIGLRVLGSKSIPWQGKTLINFQRLMPALVLEIE